MLPAEPVSRRYGLDLGNALDRTYIEGFLRANAGDVRGRVLEIHDDHYTRLIGGDRVTRGDILDADPAATRATIAGNLETGEGLPTGVFDCFICTQTLSAIYDLRAAVAHAHDVLAPGGVLLVTAPSISQISLAHDAGGFPDVFHLTVTGLRLLLAEAFGASQITVESHGNVQSAASFLYGMPIEQVDPAILSPDDPEYAVVVCGRAVRS